MSKRKAKHERKPDDERLKFVPDELRLGYGADRHAPRDPNDVDATIAATWANISGMSTDARLARMAAVKGMQSEAAALARLFDEHAADAPDWLRLRLHESEAEALRRHVRAEQTKGAVKTNVERAPKVDERHREIRAETRARLAKSESLGQITKDLAERFSLDLSTIRVAQRGGAEGTDDAPVRPPKHKKRDS